MSSRIPILSLVVLVCKLTLIFSCYNNQQIKTQNYYSNRAVLQVLLYKGNETRFITVYTIVGFFFLNTFTNHYMVRWTKIWK